MTVMPPLLMLTDRRQLPPGRSLVEQVARAVDGGVRALVLRERDLEDRERADLAFDLAPVLAAVDGHLVVAAPELALPHGIHLRASDPLPRRHAALVGRSCHDAADLDRAGREGVDYAVVGPVAATASKPGYGPALGSTGLAALTRRPARPSLVYALGGVDAGNAAAWMRAGADGVAVMGALMRADDPAAVAADLLAAVAMRKPEPAGSRP